MRIAVVSNLVTEDVARNQNRILQLATEAINNEAELLLFPETAATGLVISGNPENDLKIAETIPGPRNKQWSSLSAEYGIYFGAGLLERDGKRIFDSAVLFNPDGELILHYRRNDSGWHSLDDDPKIYCEDDQIPVVDSPIGRLAFLICGDLWNDEVLRRLQTDHPEYLLYILARDIIPRTQVKQIWESEFLSYRNRWKSVGSHVLAANLFCNYENAESIGGAWYIKNNGEVLVSIPILQEGFLLIDL